MWVMLSPQGEGNRRRPAGGGSHSAPQLSRAATRVGGQAGPACGARGLARALLTKGRPHGIVADAARDYGAWRRK